jgi:hypothetical protein
VSGSDPTGDTQPVSDCHPDITAFAGSYLNQTISVGHSVACTSNPNTDPNWTSGMTGIVWAIDVNADNSPDFLVLAANGGSGLVAEVDRASDLTKVCNAVPHWDGDRVFVAAFLASCVGSPPSFRMQAFMVWDNSPGQASCMSTCPRDWAPDGTSFSPDIAQTVRSYDSACAAATQAFPDAGLAANCLKLYGVALGKADGTFGENDSLIRSQVSSLLARLVQQANITLTQRHSFPDVNAQTVPNQQVRDEIELLSGSGIIAGFPDGTFGPASTLTVAQAATLVVRTLAFIHARNPNAADVQDQGSTSANYDYARSITVLELNPADAHGSAYPTQPTDATERGLLADMLAASLQGLVDRSVIAKRSGSCTASVSNPTPGQGGSETVSVTSSVPNAGVTVTAHYKTTDSTFTGQTDGTGNGSVTFSIGNPTSGFTVVVDVNVGGGQATCQTSFTPQ